MIHQNWSPALPKTGPKTGPHFQAWLFNAWWNQYLLEDLRENTREIKTSYDSYDTMTELDLGLVSKLDESESDNSGRILKISVMSTKARFKIYERMQIGAGFSLRKIYCQILDILPNAYTFIYLDSSR